MIQDLKKKYAWIVLVKKIPKLLSDWVEWGENVVFKTLRTLYTDMLSAEQKNKIQFKQFKRELIFQIIPTGWNKSH